MVSLFRKPVKKYFFRCRIEWNRIWMDPHALLQQPSYEKMRASIFQEHHYKFPEPRWIWRNIQNPPSSKIDPEKIFTEHYQQNIQIALTRKAKELGLSTALEDFWTAYSFFTPIFVEILDMSEMDMENYTKTDFLYRWYHRGGESGESSVDIGHACCTLHIFLNSPQFLLTWWERETRVLTHPELEKWSAQIRTDMELIFHGWKSAQNDSDARFAKFVGDFFAKAHQFTRQARKQSGDADLHFYQNPKWEKIYANREGMDWVREHFAKNRHPDSLKWVDIDKV